MSLTQILDELPKLSFAERWELVDRAMELGDSALSVEEEALLNERMDDFEKSPGSGLALDELKPRLAQHIGKE